jgi:hypothetical protein
MRSGCGQEVGAPACLRSSTPLSHLYLSRSPTSGPMYIGPMMARPSTTGALIVLKRCAGHHDCSNALTSHPAICDGRVQGRSDIANRNHALWAHGRGSKRQTRGRCPDESRAMTDEIHHGQNANTRTRVSHPENDQKLKTS